MESTGTSSDLAKRASALAFLNIFFHGALCGMLSVIVKPCAEALQIENSDVVFTYSIFSLASTVLIQVSSSYLLPRFQVSKILTGASTLLLISVYLFYEAYNTTSLSWAFVFLGFGLGMAFATANFLLVSHYEGRERSSKLALMTFYYCIGAVLTPAVGGQLLKQGYPWQIAFLWPIVICWAGAVISHFVPINAERREEKIKTRFGNWSTQVYLVALALFLFTTAEISFTNWLNVDGEEVMGLTTEHAAYLASIFWFVVGIGRYSASRILLRLSDKVFVLLSCFTAVLGFVLYTQVDSFVAAALAVAILGLGLSSVNPTLVSLGTTFSKNPALLGFLLTIGSLGPVVAPVSSQWVYSRYGSYGNVLACVGLLLFVVILISALRPGEQRDVADRA